MKKTVLSLSHAEYCQLKTSITTVDSFLDFIKVQHVQSTNTSPDERTQIPQISIPKLSEPVILSGVNDLMLPEQVAKDLKARNDVLEVADFSAYTKTEVSISNHIQENY